MRKALGERSYYWFAGVGLFMLTAVLVVLAIATAVGLLPLPGGTNAASSTTTTTATIQPGPGETASARDADLPGDPGQTDFTVFVCREAWDRDGGRNQAIQIDAALSRSGEAGDIANHEWTLYDEVSLTHLRDKLVIIEDADHPEAEVATWAADYRASEGIAGRDQIQLIDNPGPETPWRLSIISCPSE